jgi:hypothetical protein
MYNPTGSFTYSNLFFDVWYQPLNSLRISYTKSDTNIDLPLEQLDTSENGISSFDDLGAVETDKINRLGNEIVSIKQRIDDLFYMKGLNSEYDGHTVFKMTVAYHPTFASVNYFASKDYVMRNYSTAIQTKYRAYQYVDYAQSIVRKENKKVYVLIDTYQLDADVLLTFKGNAKQYLTSGLTGTTGTPLSYAVQIDAPLLSLKAKSEMSVCTYGSNLLFTFQDFDNVSPGIHINATYSTASSLGGLPQEWYIWAVYPSSVAFVQTLPTIPNTDTIWGDVAYANAYYLNVWADPYVNYDMSDDYTAIQLKDVLYYHDASEVINHTLQFEFYTNNPNIRWTSHMAELSGLVAQEHTWTYYAMPTSDSTLSEEGYALPSGLPPLSSYMTLQNAYGSIECWLENLAK